MLHDALKLLKAYKLKTSAFLSVIYIKAGVNVWHLPSTISNATCDLFGVNRCQLRSANLGPQTTFLALVLPCASLKHRFRT